MKSKQDNLSRSLKAAGIEGGVTARQSPWDMERIKDTPGKPKKKKHKTSALIPISRETSFAMAKDRSLGMSEKQVADKYSVATCLVREALKRVYTGTAVGRELLKNVILEGAIATSTQALKKVGELNPVQSVAAAGLLTSKFIELDKHTQNTPQAIDFAQLKQVHENLQSLDEELGDIDDDDGVIDIEAFVKKKKKS